MNKRRKIYFVFLALIVLKGRKDDVFKCKNIFYINIGRYFFKILSFFLFFNFFLKVFDGKINQ